VDPPAHVERAAAAGEGDRSAGAMVLPGSDDGAMEAVRSDAHDGDVRSAATGGRPGRRGQAGRRSLDADVQLAGVEDVEAGVAEHADEGGGAPQGGELVIGQRRSGGRRHEC
jgi:hypothetical protein